MRMPEPNKPQAKKLEAEVNRTPASAQGFKTIRDLYLTFLMPRVYKYLQSNPRCKHCRSQQKQTIVRIRDMGLGQIVVTFKCSRCEKVWSTSFNVVEVSG